MKTLEMSGALNQQSTKKNSLILAGIGMNIGSPESQESIDNTSRMQPWDQSMPPSGKSGMDSPNRIHKDSLDMEISQL